MKSYYKVVHVDGSGRLLSAIVYRKACAVEYKVGAWVKPPFGKLLVFDDLYRALIFATSIDLRVYECGVRYPRPLTRLSWWQQSCAVLEQFWKRPMIPEIIRMEIPSGSVAVSAVKLLREIH